MATQDLVYVGTYSEPILFGTGEVVQGQGKGIYRFRLDADAGALALDGITEGVRNSSYLAFDPQRRFLYCVNEFKEFEGKASGAVSAFAIDPDSGDLTFLNMKASHGTDPCHLTVDATGRFLLVANFASGSVCVLPINDDGSLQEASQVIQHEGSSVDPKRQTGPHAHAVTLDNANRYPVRARPRHGQGDDLCLRCGDRPSHARMRPSPSIATKPGAGPAPDRHASRRRASPISSTSSIRR